MKNVIINTTKHPQNKKDVEGIKILNNQFVLSDKRGRNTFTPVSVDFANKLIHTFEVEKGRTGLDLYFPERVGNTNELRLSWVLLGDYRVQLRLHNGGSHIWTSKPINY